MTSDLTLRVRPDPLGSSWLSDRNDVVSVDLRQHRGARLPL